jgi:ubiquinone/menaquinone biosynthesis C-methylase UbiE
MPDHRNPDQPPRHHEVFSASCAGHLDSRLRKLLYRPGRIADRYVRERDRVLDIGCGPGLFTREFARKAGESGLVIAVDIQDEMLRMLEERAKKEGLMSRIRTHKAAPDTLGLAEYDGSVNAAFALYVVHEVPDAARLLREVSALLVPGGVFLIAEPRFVVPAAEFRETLEAVASAGFIRIGSQPMFLSRTALFRKDKSG